MTTRSKILFYACQIAVIYSTPGGRWWCDIHSRSQIRPLLLYLIVMASLPFLSKYWKYFVHRVL